jgi:hypothetical protein
MDDELREKIILDDEWCIDKDYLRYNWGWFNHIGCGWTEEDSNNYKCKNCNKKIPNEYWFIANLYRMKI